MKWTLIVRAVFRDDTYSTEGNRLKAILKKQCFKPTPSVGKKPAQYWKRPDVETDEAAGLIKELLASPLRTKYPVRRIRKLLIEARPTYTPPL
jgi:hypothetical protein